MEYFLALLFVLALVQVYFGARRKARRAVYRLNEAVHTAELQDAAVALAARSPCRLESGRQLLAKAEEALDCRDWDRAEEICLFAESALGLVPAPTACA